MDDRFRLIFNMFCVYTFVKLNLTLVFVVVVVFNCRFVMSHHVVA